MPLGNNETFIFNDSQNKCVKKITFYLNKDSAMLHQAQKYIVCKDKDHLQKVIEIYNHLEARGQIGMVNRYIFQFAYSATVRR